MKKFNVRFIAESAIIAGLYVALTWLLAPISYGAVQFRISEFLILLVVLNPKYAYALVIGCFIANTTSPMGWYDMVFGTAATLLAVLPMLKIKRLEIAALFPVISNAILVSIELGLAFDLFAIEAFGFNVLTVGLGEAVVLYCIGIPAMLALCNNETMVDLLELEKQHVVKHTTITLPRCLSTVIGALGIIFFVAYPFLTRTDSETMESTTYSALALVKEQPWVVIFCVFSVVTIVWGLFTKGKVKFLGNILLWIGFLVSYIFVGVIFEEAAHYPYFYGYILYVLLFALIGCYIFYIEDLKSRKERLV